MNKAATLTEIMLAVFRINGRLLEKGDELVRPLAINSARWQVLGAVALAGKPLTAPQMAEAMGITRQGAQKQINKLLEEGLLVQLPNPRHLRSPRHELSDRGRQVYAGATDLNALWSARLAEDLSPAALETTLATLNRFFERLDAPVPGPGEK